MKEVKKIMFSSAVPLLVWAIMWNLLFVGGERDTHGSRMEGKKSGIASAPSPALCLRSSLTCFNATHFFHFYKPLLLTVLLFSHTAKCHACQRQRCRGQRKPSDSPTHSLFFSHLKFLLLSRLQRRIRKNYLHRGSCNAVMCNGWAEGNHLGWGENVWTLNCVR